MKKSLISILIILSLSALPFLAVAAERTNSPGSADTKQKDQSEISMEERFRKIGKDLDELEAKSQSLAEKAKKEMDRHIRDAEKKRKAAGRKLEELKTEGMEKEKKLKKDLNAALDDFEEAFEKAKAHFKE